MAATCCHLVPQHRQFSCSQHVSIAKTFLQETSLNKHSLFLGKKLKAHSYDRTKRSEGCTMSMAPSNGSLLWAPHQDKFLPLLADVARSRPHIGGVGAPPLLDAVQARMAETATMNAPAQVERSADYGEHKPTTPPPDLPSLLLNSRIIYIGMPLVPAVTELLIAQLLYLQYLDPRQPIYVYVNSSGTSRADGETVGMETEGFAIYDTMMQVKNEIQTVGVGVAIGQACLLLAAGEKGKRFMLPHATAMIQQPRLPSTGLMQAIDVQIRAREVLNNRDTLVKLLARHTGNEFDKVNKAMERPFYMTAQRAIEFGVADKILWRGQEAMAEVTKSEEWDRRAGVRQVERPAPSYGGGERGLG